jgi:uncharacterized protein YpmB
MNDFTMMYIFFAINTLFISLLCILLIVLIFYTYRMFKKIEQLVERAKEAGIKATSAFEEVTGTVRTESQDVVAGISQLIQKILPKKETSVDPKN